MVYAAFGALAGMASTLVGLGVAAAWWSDKGASFAWGNAGMWTTIGGGIAWNVAFAAVFAAAAVATTVRRDVS